MDTNLVRRKGGDHNDPNIIDEDNERRAIASLKATCRSEGIERGGKHRIATRSPAHKSMTSNKSEIVYNSQTPKLPALPQLKSRRLRRSAKDEPIIQANSNFGKSVETAYLHDHVPEVGDSRTPHTTIHASGPSIVAQNSSVVHVINKSLNAPRISAKAISIDLTEDAAEKVYGDYQGDIVKRSVDDKLISKKETFRHAEERVSSVTVLVPSLGMKSVNPLLGCLPDCKSQLSPSSQSLALGSQNSLHARETKATSFINDPIKSGTKIHDPVVDCICCVSNLVTLQTLRQEPGAPNPHPSMSPKLKPLTPMAITSMVNYIAGPLNAKSSNSTKLHLDPISHESKSPHFDTLVTCMRCKYNWPAYRFRSILTSSPGNNGQCSLRTLGKCMRCSRQRAVGDAMRLQANWSSERQRQVLRHQIRVIRQWKDELDSDGYFLSQTEEAQIVQCVRNATAFNFSEDENDIECGETTASRVSHSRKRKFGDSIFMDDSGEEGLLAKLQRRKNGRHAPVPNSTRYVESAANASSSGKQEMSGGNSSQVRSGESTHFIEEADDNIKANIFSKSAIPVSTLTQIERAIRKCAEAFKFFSETAQTLALDRLQELGAEVFSEQWHAEKMEAWATLTMEGCRLALKKQRTTEELRRMEAETLAVILARRKLVGSTGDFCARLVTGLTDEMADDGEPDDEVESNVSEGDGKGEGDGEDEDDDEGNER